MFIKKNSCLLELTKFSGKIIHHSESSTSVLTFFVFTGKKKIKKQLKSKYILIF